MPASVVIVHDDTIFLDTAATALRAAGHDVATYDDPMVALNALESATQIEVLVTRVRYAEGKPNGVALALMTRVKRPGLKIIFTALPEYESHTEGIGEFMALPIDVPKLVHSVNRLIQEHRSGSD